MIDYNKNITREDLDLDYYNSKFTSCDAILSLKPETKKDTMNKMYQMKRLLNDPTTDIYIMFKLDCHPLMLYPYQDMIINDTHRYKYFRAANQIGKAEYVKNLIPTPNGFKLMGDLQEGDFVFDSNGNKTKIIGIPYKGTRPCYKLTFDDGSTLIVAKEHEWICKTEKERFRKKYKHNRGKKKGIEYKNKDYNKWVTLSTEDIILKGKYKPKTIPRLKISIPITQPVEYGEKYYNISPYTIGALLGDGCLTNSKSVSFSSGDYHMVERLSNELRSGSMLCKANHYVINIFGEDVKLLKKLNLIGKYSNTKFIPKQYLYGSIEQRLELLKGLMDTDGSVYGKYSTLEYCTVSELLKNDFIELINSLGGIINKVTEKKPFYYNRDKDKVYGQKAYSIRFKIDLNPFWIDRKASKFKQVTKYRKERLIESIEYVGELPTKCISVDSKDNSYLSSVNYIVTHNSLLLDAVAARNLLIDHGKGHNEAIVSKSLPQSTFQMRRVKALLRSSNVEWKQDSSTESLSVITVDKKDKDGKVKYTNMLVCAPSTEGLLGYDLHSLNLDEFEFWDVDLEHFFTQIAQPRTYTTKGKITIFSNPNGQDSYGTTLENQKTLDGNRKWHVYEFNYLDKPGNTIEEYNELKNELSRSVFESTVDAKRSISDRNYFTPDEIHGSYDKHLKQTDMVGKQPFFFLDVGAKHDQSVLCGGYLMEDEDNPRFMHLYIPIIHVYPVGYPLTRVVGANVDDSDGWHHEKSIKEYLEEWGYDGIIPTFGYDVTGNTGIKALFESINIYGQDITFTGPSKSGMYQRFKWFMEKKLLHRIKSDEWVKQASTLVVVKTARGHLQIKHERESDLDDCMDATAGLIYLAYPTESVEYTCELL